MYTFEDEINLSKKKKKNRNRPKYFGCPYGQPVLKIWLSGAKSGCPGQPDNHLFRALHMLRPLPHETHRYQLSNQ